MQAWSRKRKISEEWDLKLSNLTSSAMLPPPKPSLWTFPKHRHQLGNQVFNNVRLMGALSRSNHHHFYSDFARFFFSWMICRHACWAFQKWWRHGLSGALHLTSFLKPQHMGLLLIEISQMKLLNILRISFGWCPLPAGLSAAFPTWSALDL